MFDIHYRKARRTDRCLATREHGKRDPQIDALIAALEDSPQVAMCNDKYPTTEALGKYFRGWGRAPRDHRPVLSVRTLETRDGVLITKR